LLLAVFVLYGNCGLFWFRAPYVSFEDSELVLADQPELDFRGCYGSPVITFCLVVAKNTSFPGLSLIAPYVEGEELWVTPNNNIKFGGNMPSSPQWVARVPHQRVRAPAVLPPMKVADAPDPKIKALVDSISMDNIDKTIRHLAAFFTRNSYAKESVEASNWLKDQATALGCEDATSYPFRNGFSPNIYCMVHGKTKGDTEEIIVIGAHYDDRSTVVTSPTQRAPGADDNGSGSASVMEILRAVKQSGIAFQKSFMFVWFSGEEQGLFGSAALAADLVDRANITLSAMINLDMIGWIPDHTQRIVYFDRDRVTVGLRDLGRDLVTVYLPHLQSSLAVGCCSDGNSFYNLGVPTASMFEYSSLRNPHYHRSTDEPDTLSMQHVTDTAQAAAALFATLAVPV